MGKELQKKRKKNQKNHKQKIYMTEKSSLKRKRKNYRKKYED